VTLALRGAGPQAQPVVHWLAVHPAWRRRGVGRLLMAALEACAWDAGGRTLALETHEDWRAAIEFYGALGYTSGQPPVGAAAGTIEHS
jgi:GNAT superfamily N-acetyltransferase